LNPDKGAGGKQKRRGRSLVPPSPSITRPGEKAEDQALGALGEYTKSEQGGGKGSAGHPVASGDAPAGAPSPSGEPLVHDWDIEEPAGPEVPLEDEIAQRLERLEKRLDSFENTCYTFLLYAKQLTDRTVSFFEDIFGLSQEDLAQIHDRLGVNYNNKGDHSKAIEAFNKLVELKRTPASCYKLGVAHDNNGDHREAVEAFQSAIALDASYLKAYYKLADVYAKTENFGEAIRCLTEAVGIDSENPETHFRLGSIHSARGSFDQAIGSLNRVVELDPGYPGIYQSLGLAYEHKGEHNKAIEYFKKSL
jgi:tetratricopeptide (TPR) repeat protein